MGPWVGLLVSMGLGLVTSGCAPSGLNFFTDTRVSISSPSELARVNLPYTIQWRAHDIKSNEYFGVFVDRPPLAPGADVSSWARRDELCRKDPTCPTAEYLAERDIYVRRDTTVTLEQLADSRLGGRGLDKHTVTIVILDQAGRRIGESAWTRDFAVDHSKDGP